MAESSLARCETVGGRVPSGARSLCRGDCSSDPPATLPERPHSLDTDDHNDDMAQVEIPDWARAHCEMNGLDADAIAAAPMHPACEKIAAKARRTFEVFERVERTRARAQRAATRARRRPPHHPIRRPVARNRRPARRVRNRAHAAHGPPREPDDPHEHDLGLAVAA